MLQVIPLISSVILISLFFLSYDKLSRKAKRLETMLERGIITDEECDKREKEYDLCFVCNLVKYIENAIIIGLLCDGYYALSIALLSIEVIFWCPIIALKITHNKRTQVLIKR